MIVSTDLIAKKATFETLWRILNGMNNGFVLLDDPGPDEEPELQCSCCKRYEWLGHTKDCEMQKAIGFLDEMIDAIDHATTQEWLVIEEILFGSQSPSLGRWK